MRVVVAEKPSVARDLARVLGATNRRQGYLEGNGLMVTWCVGHMVELEDPAHYDSSWKRWSFDTLPMLPETFSLRVRKGIADQWKVLKKLLRDKTVLDVVNACDAGREGELIFRYVYDLSGCKAPVMRLWVSSMTDQAINGAWSSLRDGTKLDPLADAARCRSEADWLVGLNATRAMTCLARKGGGSQLLSVGRVQTPTLAMIVRRDHAIAHFIPETFYQVHAHFSADQDAVDASWRGTWFRREEAKAKTSKDDEAPRAERIIERELAESIADAVRGQHGTVGMSERKQTRERPPLLYDLTALQRRANQRYGISAAGTLSIAQDLYEKHKLITYPRTDARYLTPDQVPELPGVVRGVGGLAVYKPFCDTLLQSAINPGKRVINAAEVGDHHAIIPTPKTARANGLSPDEKRVYDLVARRFLAALSDDALFDATTIIVEMPRVDAVEEDLLFRAKGRVCTQQGWRAVDPPAKKKQTDLPYVPEGQLAVAEKAEVKEGQTRPPRPFTDASILHSMETAGRTLDDAELKRAMRSGGLGTPATRAAILQVLLKRGYAIRDKKALISTERGRALIAAVPVDELKSPELTGRWEARLAAMAEGNDQRSEFMTGTREYTRRLVEAIEAADPPPAEAAEPSDAPVLGDCPVCGKPVREGRAAFSCDTGRACSFVIFKKVARRAVSARMAKQLITTGYTGVVKGFRSKKNKPFSAALALTADARVSLEFENAPKTPVGLSCPECRQGRLIAGRTAWGCNRWKEGCTFRLPFVFNDRTLSEVDASILVRHGRLGRCMLRDPEAS
jgi:DNA topoisomerase III